MNYILPGTDCYARHIQLQLTASSDLLSSRDRQATIGESRALGPKAASSDDIGCVC